MRIRLKIIVPIVLFLAGMAWLSLNPGTLTIDWFGYEVKTSITFLFLLLFLLFVVAATLNSGWRGLVWFVKEILNIGSYLKKDPNHLLAEAFSAIEFGNYKDAQKIARQAMNLMPESALPAIALLKASQKAGDTRSQNIAFGHLKKFQSFAPIAYYDEIENAFQKGDIGHAKKLLSQAEKDHSDTPWFLKQSLKLLILSKKWSEALSTLDTLSQKSQLPQVEEDQIYAIIWYELAKMPKADPVDRLAMMEKAYEYAPLFLDNLIDLAHITLDRKDKRAAQTLLESTWNKMPSWRIAQAYCEILGDKTPLKRAQRARQLYDIRPDHPVSRLILIRYFIDAKLWGEAKRVLHLIPRDVPESYVLRAALAQKEKGDIDKVIDHLQTAVKKISYPYKCTSCRKSMDQWHAFCTHCTGFLTVYLKHPITYADCLEALE